MAITRAQQAKQMLRDGGMSLQEAKDMAPEGEFLAYINPKEAKMLKAAGGSGVMTKAGIPSFIDYGDVESGLAGGEFGGGSPQDTFGGGGGDQEDDNARMMQAVNLTKAPPKKPTNIGGRDGPNLNFAEKFRIASLKNLYDQKTGQKKAIPSFGSILSTFKPAQEFYEEEDTDLDQYGLSGKTLTDLSRLAKAINKGEKTGNISQTEFEKAFYGPEGPRQLGSSNDTSDPIIPLIPKVTTDLAEEDELLKALRNRTAFRFMADGGRIGAQEGGIMPRLNQLGSGVSSAEQMLQGINERLESAESSLGGGGGNQFSQVTLPETLIETQQPPSLDKIAPGFKTGQPTAQLSGSIQNQQNKQDVVDLEQLYPNAGQNQISNFTPMRGGAEMMELAGIPAAGYADGGNVVGGEFDFESARQMYGLGKLVKKVTRGIKKIAKSPIGKAALAFGIPGTNFGGIFGRASFGGAAKGLFGQKGIAATLAAGKGKLLGIPGADEFGGTAGLLRDLGLTKGGFGTIGGLTGKGIAATIGTASLLPLLGLGTGDESEEEAQSILQSKGIDIADIRANPQKYQAMRFMAEGGSTEKEPVAKKTMPLLDMDGMEKDYRAEGGFVPIGRMEKADDVPARLSKNEFVFTADAVRNAGDGNVDKGAEVMYNMMKNLEAGGDVSEESQGLEGARKMFQTSQRLEEVL
tara:strand:- start:6358 stop:8427 length:2070 start_codon:yes stop_codon:yes gene_type:complete